MLASAASAAVHGVESYLVRVEVSLAQHGVLFLDELPELRRHVLDVLRQPMEEGTVVLSRADGTVRYPARITRYQARVSGPLMDRIDLHVEVLAVPLADAPDVRCNAHMAPAQLRLHARPNSRVLSLLQKVTDRLGLSARADHRLLKVARTSADLDGSEGIRADHAAEAIQYRSLDRRLNVSARSAGNQTWRLSKALKDKMYRRF